MILTLPNMPQKGHQPPRTKQPPHQCRNAKRDWIGALDASQLQMLERQMRFEYARPRDVSDLGECYFYHTMEIPRYGLVNGQWDLRSGIRQYTGGADFHAKRVLEIGTASGFVCFYMESQGASVVAYDLSDKQAWDIVPFAALDLERELATRRSVIRKINNGFWLAHRAFRSQAMVAYGTVYNIPTGIGPVDVSTFCSVLLHLRDPFLALSNAARLTRETIVVTDTIVDVAGVNESRTAPSAETRPLMTFLPDARTTNPVDTWWRLSAGAVQAFLGVLGFEESTVTEHVQRSTWGDVPMFSVVAQRTSGKPLC